MVSLHLIEKAKAGSEEAIQEIFKSFQGIMLLKNISFMEEKKMMNFKRQ